jgi:hypothetical protein
MSPRIVFPPNQAGWHPGFPGRDVPLSAGCRAAYACSTLAVAFAKRSATISHAAATHTASRRMRMFGE